MLKTINTKFGIARISNDGYWRITSSKEGNNGKRLHRLIFEDYHKCTLLPNAVIHHRDGNKLNNRYENLELMSRGEHSILHHKGENNHMWGKNHSDETKQKISENNARYWEDKKLSDEHKRKLSENSARYWEDKKFSDEHKMKISESHNTSGYFRVYKHKNNTCKQGFIWRYSYYDDDKKKAISSISLKKLEEKVKAKGLPWLKFEEQDVDEK